jgi:hypothetical protein
MEINMKNRTKYFETVAIATCLLIAAGFSSAAQAQTVEEVSQINLGGGVTLYSSLTTRQDPAPSNLFLKLTGVKTNPSAQTSDAHNTEKKGSITVSVRGTPASKTTPSGTTAPTTVFAAYGVLSGAVTPNYASYVAANVDDVTVDFTEGEVDQPVIIGSIYNGGGMGIGKAEFREFAIAKFADTASPSIYKQLVANEGAQFNIANPEVSVLTPACANVAAQLDVDSNGDLLVRVFQGSDTLFPNVTVVVTVTPTGTATPFQVEAITDANGLAQFNGAANTVALNSQNPVTGISLQFSADGAAETCVIQGNSNPCETFAAHESAARNGTSLSRVLKQEADSEE